MALPSARLRGRHRFPGLELQRAAWNLTNRKMRGRTTMPTARSPHPCSFTKLLAGKKRAAQLAHWLCSLALALPLWPARPTPRLARRTNSATRKKRNSRCWLGPTPPERALAALFAPLPPRWRPSQTPFALRRGRSRSLPLFRARAASPVQMPSKTPLGGLCCHPLRSLRPRLTPRRRLPRLRMAQWTAAKRVPSPSRRPLRMAGRACAPAMLHRASQERQIAPASALGWRVTR